MKNFKVVSMNFTSSKPCFVCSRKRARKEQEMMKVVTSYFCADNNQTSVLLLQGKDLDKRSKQLGKKIDYRIYGVEDDCSSILVPKGISVANNFSFPGIGNAVIIPIQNQFLSLFSITLSNEDVLASFMASYDDFINPHNSKYTNFQVIGGVFPSKESLQSLVEHYQMFDVATDVPSTCSELKNDRYSILLSRGLESCETTRQTGLVKEKHMRNCPISTRICTTNL